MFGFFRKKKKKVYDKWFLLIFATLVVCIGIGNELFKGTSALDETPANPAFDDINFYKCVIDSYNKKNDKNVSYDTNLTDDELNTITDLYCNGDSLDGTIKSTNGLEKLISLVELDVSSNELTTIDVSNNLELKDLNIDFNRLIELDVTNNLKLIMLSAVGNHLTELDVTKNIELLTFDVSQNKLTELDVSKNLQLNLLWVDDNELTKLDVTKNIELIDLDVSDNLLTELDVSNNLELLELRIEYNNLKELDITKNFKLTELFVSANKLTEIDASNNINLVDLLIKENAFKETIYVYKGNSVVVGNNVKIPEHYYMDKPIWTSKNTDVATVNSDGLVTTLKGGNVLVTGVVENEYDTISSINIVEITSDEYVINEVNNYIVINNDSDVETIKNNINLSHEDVSLNVDLENNKLQVMYNDKVLKEYNLNTDGNDNNDNHFEIESDYNIDNSNNVISNVQLGITGNSLIDNINTNGTISLLDKNDNVLTLTDILKTGDKVKVSYEGYSVVYKISVTGDATGDGKIANDDINVISNYIIDGNLDTDKEYLYAMDFDGDGNININDVIKIIRYIENNGDVNE